MVRQRASKHGLVMGCERLTGIKCGWWHILGAGSASSQPEYHSVRGPLAACAHAPLTLLALIARLSMLTDARPCVHSVSLAGAERNACIHVHG